MTTDASLPLPSVRPATLEPVTIVVVSFVVVAAILTASVPLLVSAGIVLLFAGPHHWMEARYLITQMPPRWGRLTPYFATAATGVVLLSITYVGLVVAIANGIRGTAGWLRVWYVAMAIWIAVLMVMRSHQKPERRIDFYAGPLGAIIIGIALAFPSALALAIVFIHPLVAVVFFDRELRIYPRLRKQLRNCYALVPAVIGLLFIHFTVQSDPTATTLPNAIAGGPFARQLGANAAANDATLFVLASHTFLELLHYAIWIVAVPMISGTGPLRALSKARRQKTGRCWKPVLALVAFGLPCAVALLWVGFGIDFERTQQIYFAIAITHALAEVPFLIRTF